MRRVIKRILGWLLIVFILVNILPFGIPISSHTRFIPVEPFDESAFITVDNTMLHYRYWQPNQGSPVGKVLLVHGMGGSTFSWRETTDPLVEAGFIVVSVDLPAFGYSDRNPGIDHSQANRSALLWQMLDELDLIPGPAASASAWTLVGHSMGGGTVAAMAMDRPGDVAGLVLVAGALFDNNPGLVSYLMAYPPLGRWLSVITQNVLLKEDRIANFLASAYGRDTTADETTGYLDPLKQPGTARGLLSLVRTARSEPAERLSAYTGPSLALWGENDTWVPTTQVERVRNFLPELEVTIIPAAYHVPMETHREVFNALLLRFLVIHNP